MRIYVHYCCYLILGFHIKKYKKYKKYIFGRNPKNNRSEKIMLNAYKWLGIG
jgi:hypothetical protein